MRRKPSQIAIPTIIKSDEPPEGYVDPASLEFSHGYHSVGQLTKSEKLQNLVLAFNRDPVKAVEVLFGATPTDQQARLITEAWKPGARVAVSSCTGAGKTSTLAWLTYLFLMCKYDCRLLVTSPSFQQLNRVYYAEVLKWKTKMPKQFQSFFRVTRERISMEMDTAVQVANIVTASAENEESLQGGHSENYVILADEASAISEEAFKVLSGTLSYGITRFILASNPTRSSGMYYEIFHRIKETGESPWITMFFSAYDCPHIPQAFIQETILTYGEDSDQYRVRILGQFPRVSISQFVPTDIVERAMAREIDMRDVQTFPKVCGVDVARFGDDSTIFVTRQGPKIYDIREYHNLDGPDVASKLQEYWREHGHQAIYIDAHGVGSSAFDAAKRMEGIKDITVPLTMHLPSPKPAEYANVRAHLWGEMRNYLRGDVDMPNDQDAKAQIISQTYGYNKMFAYLLTAKKDMKSEGIPSPDIGDAISFTFAGKLYEAGGVTTTKREVKRRRKRVIGRRRV